MSENDSKDENIEQEKKNDSGHKKKFSLPEPKANFSLPDKLKQKGGSNHSGNPNFTTKNKRHR